MFDLSRVLLVHNEDMDYDTYPEVIYFKSFEELITFRTLCASQFPQLRTVTVYHLYTSGEAYLEDYGLLEDADDEEEE